MNLRRLWLVMALSAGLTIPLVASASREAVQDGKDTRGPLDVRLARHWDKRFPRWTTYTWNRWKAVKLWDRGYVVIQFDTTGNQHFDYYVMVRSDDSRLRANLFRDYVRKRDRMVAHLHLSRPDKTSVRVRVPLDKMKFSDRAHYRWKVETLWTGRHCADVCIDRVPNKGAVVVTAPEPTPTPTVTISPTPTSP